MGSSGANTANTARTDYTQPAAAESAGPVYNRQGNTGAASYGAAAPRPAAGGYYTANAGGYNGYSYTSTPPAPPAKKKKKGGAKKVLLRILAGICVLALGFAGGLGGAVAASRLGLTGNNVVVQQVQRLPQDDTAQGSAVGATLSLQDVSAMVTPSVVAITTEQMVSGYYNWFGGGYVASGAGSGVVISEDGYILTCAHVVSGAQNVKVDLSDGTEYTATIVGGDSAADIAVLKIDASGLVPAVLGDSDALAVGEVVLAVGNPLGQLGGTVTDGIVSAINREIKVEGKQMTLIQTNAAISPGNSGGGLFNANGELIGIVNAKSSSADSSGNLTDAEGLGFAIPINTAMDIAQDIIDVGHVQRAVLGVTVRTINTQELALQYGVSSYGVYVFEVDKGSGAEKAGIQVRDRIAAVGDVPVNQNDDLTGYLAQKEVGDVVTLQIERDGHLMNIDVTLGVSQG